MQWVSPQWRLSLEQIEHMALQWGKKKVAVRLTLSQQQLKQLELFTKDESQGSDEVGWVSEDEEKTVVKGVTKGAMQQTMESMLSFEQSVVIRQHFKEAVEEIAKRCNVSVRILPCKLKIVGGSVDAVGDAQEEITQLRNSILVKSFPKNGPGIFASPRIRARLRQLDVALYQISNNYYYWYVEREEKDNHTINELIMEIVFKEYCTVHPFNTFFEQCLQYNHYIPQVYAEVKDALLAQVFEKVFEHKLNMSERQSRKIELGQDRRNLVIHCDKSDHFYIQKERISEMYKEYGYFIIVLPSDNHIKTIKQSIKSLQGNNTVLVYFKNQQLSEEEICKCVMGVLYLKKGQPLNLVRHVIEIVFQKETLFQIGQFINEKIQEKFILERDGYQLISPKFKRLKDYVQIVSKYILAEKNHTIKSKQIHKQMIQYSVGDVSKLKDQTSLNISNSTSFIKDRSILINNCKNNNLLLSQFTKKEQAQKINLQKYKYYFKEADAQKKYYEGNQIQISQLPQNSSKQIPTTLKNICGSNLKIFQTRIPQKHKIILQGVCVTVATKQLPYKGDKITVKLLNKELHGKGYLLNVPLQKLVFTLKQFTVNIGEYEVIRYFNIF